MAQRHHGSEYVSLSTRYTGAGVGPLGKYSVQPSVAARPGPNASRTVQTSRPSWTILSSTVARTSGSAGGAWPTNQSSTKSASSCRRAGHSSRLTLCGRPSRMVTSGSWMNGTDGRASKSGGSSPVRISQSSKYAHGGRILRSSSSTLSSSAGRIQTLRLLHGRHAMRENGSTLTPTLSRQGRGGFSSVAVVTLVFQLTPRV